MSCVRALRLILRNFGRARTALDYRYNRGRSYSGKRRFSSDRWTRFRHRRSQTGLEAAIQRHGAPFLERLFTPAEVSYCERHKNKFERYAARFAAKEAAMKALGTGWSHGVRWRDIEVTQPRRLASPPCILPEPRSQIADRLGVKSISVSITHSGNLALAQVIFES